MPAFLPLNSAASWLIQKNKTMKKQLFLYAIGLILILILRAPFVFTQQRAARTANSSHKKHSTMAADATALLDMALGSRADRSK